MGGAPATRMLVSICSHEHGKAMLSRDGRDRVSYTLAGSFGDSEGLVFGYKFVDRLTTAGSVKMDQITQVSGTGRDHERRSFSPHDVF